MVGRAVGSEDAPERVFGSVDVEHEFKDETSVNVGGAPLETTAKATGARLGLGGEFAMREGGEFAMREGVVPRARADYTRSGGDTNEYGGGVELNLRFQARFAKRSPGARADEARALFFPVATALSPVRCAVRALLRQSGSTIPRCSISTPPQRSFRYSATSRRWQWCGWSSLHGRQPSSSTSLEIVSSIVHRATRRPVDGRAS